MDEIWDCIVVGGGAAGLSAALVLGRARRRTLLVDSGGQSNLAAHAVGGLLGHDGRPPAELYAAAGTELAAYQTVERRSAKVVDGRRTDPGFALELDDGARERARRVVLATGMDYRHPALPGIAERWGHSAFHCPFCHGWEVRDRALAVLGADAQAAHRALLLKAWSDDVTLLADGPADLDPDATERLRAAGVAVEERPVAGLRGPARELDAVVFADGGERACGALLVPVTLHQRDGLAAALGAANRPPGPILADGLEIDARFETTAPGVFAAGDLAATMPSVAAAVASGHAAAAMVVGTLVA